MRPTRTREKIMKKFVFNWLAMLLAIVFCAGFVSCKDDDDEKVSPSDSGLLLGTWRTYDGSWYYDMTFYEGGRGLEEEHADGSLSDTYGFLWKKENNTLTIIYDDDIEKVIPYTIVSLTSEVMVLMEEDGDTYTYRKILESENQGQADVFSHLLQGHWSYDDGTLRETFSFGSKGEGSIVYEYSNYPGNNEYEIIASGTYVVTGYILTAKYTNVRVYTSYGSESYNGFTEGQNKTVSYTLVSCDGSRLVLKEGDRTLTVEKFGDL